MSRPAVPFEVGDVTLDEENAAEVEILSVMHQDEGPAYWVRYLDTGMTTVRFHEELAEV
jgi:hypothetical protein